MKYIVSAFLFPIWSNSLLYEILLPVSWTALPHLGRCRIYNRTVGISSFMPVIPNSGLDAAVVYNEKLSWPKRSAGRFPQDSVELHAAKSAVCEDQYPPIFRKCEASEHLYSACYKSSFWHVKSQHGSLWSLTCQSLLLPVFLLLHFTSGSDHHVLLRSLIISRCCCLGTQKPSLELL